MRFILLTPIVGSHKTNIPAYIEHDMQRRMVAPLGSNDQAINLGARKRQADSSFAEETKQIACPRIKKRKINHPSSMLPELYENTSQQYVEKNAIKALQKLLKRNQTSAEPSYSRPLANPYFGRTRFSCKRLAKIVAVDGPCDLSDLRGYKSPATSCGAMSSSQSSLGRRKRASPKKSSRSPSKSRGTTSSTSTKSTGPYDRSFRQHLIDHGSLPPGYEYHDGRLPPEPENLAEIERVLANQDTSPAQFSDEDFRQFKRQDSHATRESQVVIGVIPILEGEVSDPRSVCGDISFTNLDHLTDGTLVAAKPDRCFGNRPESLRRPIRDLLSNQICPFTQEDLPIIPNCFLEVKGPDGSAAVAERQLLYDMSLGERGYLCLLSYGSAKPIYDGKAHTVGFSYLSGQLKAYTCHAVPPTTPKNRPTFVMTHINSWSVGGNRAQFCNGANAYRNGIRWAKAMRDRVIKFANETAASLASSVLSSGEADSDASGDGTITTSQGTVVQSGYSISKVYESDTSADELSLDQPPPKRKSQSPSKRP